MPPLSPHVAATGAILRIRLNSPPGNILDIATLQGIAHALRQSRGRPWHAIVFSAAGAHFSYGASIQEHAPDRVESMFTAWREVFTEIIELGAPAIAVVRGRCLGGGLELAAFCHFLLADTTAVFAAPEIKLGIFAPYASLILPWRIGQTQADRMLLSGMDMTAEKALACGLAQGVFPPELLESNVEHFIAATLQGKSAFALRQATRAARREFHDSFQRWLPVVEAQYRDELLRSPDAAEGMRAFLEKRPPAWRHQ